jgi:tellurite resistance protein
MNARRWVVPASFFSMVLGLAGLGTDWRAAAHWWGLPGWVGEAVMGIAAAVWALLMALYGLKWLRHRTEALAEIAHPIQCCFVALAPVTTMLVGIAALRYSRTAALVLCGLGTVAALAFGAWRHGGLWRGGRSVDATTPVLYLPTVAANLVSAMAAGALGWPELGQLFFGAGVLAWLALESVIVGRLLYAETMPLPLRPTLGIQPAPPAVTLLAYSSVTTGPPDLVAHALLGYALVQALVVARLLPWVRQPFTPGYWAFTFGVTAIASATIRYAERGGDWVFTALAPVLFVVANVVVVGLFIATVLAAVRGRLLPGPPAQPVQTPRESPRQAETGSMRD